MSAENHWSDIVADERSKLERLKWERDALDKEILHSEEEYASMQERIRLILNGQDKLTTDV